MVTRVWLSLPTPAGRSQWSAVRHGMHVFVSRAVHACISPVGRIELKYLSIQCSTGCRETEHAYPWAVQYLPYHICMLDGDDERH